jgi:hypothetical protein
MRNTWALALTAGSVVVGLHSARAQTATFQIDPAASSLTVSGTALGAPIQPQDPGSLTTTYRGPLFVQLTPDTIHLPGGSAVAANNNGSWQPLPGGMPGSAPANYGGRVVILFTNSFAAVRDAVFDGTTPAPFALEGSGNTRAFSSGIDFTATSGQIDYNSPLAGSGSNPIAGSTATNQAGTAASLHVSAGSAGFASAALTLPVSFSITTELGTFGQGVFNFNGSTTARASARPGDANFDGNVNLGDFNTLAANFGTSGNGWLDADFDFDGNVNLSDFNLLAANFGMSASVGGPTPEDWSALASAVPEPSFGLVSVAMLPALRRRRTV